MTNKHFFDIIIEFKTLSLLHFALVLRTTIGRPYKFNSAFCALHSALYLSRCVRIVFFENVARKLWEQELQVVSIANGRAGVNEVPVARQSREVTEPQRDRVLSGLEHKYKFNIEVWRNW